MTRIHVFLLLAAFSSAGAAADATLGTAEAATETALVAAAKALSIAASPAQVQGDTAKVRVVVGKVECSVFLQRDRKGPQGWLVTKMDCPSSK